MEMQEVLRALDGQRVRAEHDLAHGDWGRARRRVADALGRIHTALCPPEPEVWGWVRLLAALARVDRARSREGQLSLWPELEEGPRDPSAFRDVRAPRAALGVLSRDRRMLGTLAFLADLAPTDLPVLVEGESGTGKEVVARAVHEASGRAAGEFVPVNCGAIPMELHESELFGHSRGAYTGATQEKPGLFEAAHGGTLFLDEIGEMDPRAQVKLLRVLESGELRRLGEVRQRRVSVRVIAATNACVDDAVARGRFRRDLLFRLGAVRVWLPPLRERPADVLLLAHHFLRRAALPHPQLTPGAQMALLAHAWPGNVRELKFAIERGIALWARSGRAALGEEFLRLGAYGVMGSVLGGVPAEEPASEGDESVWTWPTELPVGFTLDGFLREIERRLIARAIAQTGGNRTIAARALGGLSRTTLIGRMKRLGLFEATSGSGAVDRTEPGRTDGQA
jgi:two-component system NtrC family response regulator